MPSQSLPSLENHNLQSMLQHDTSTGITGHKTLTISGFKGSYYLSPDRYRKADPGYELSVFLCRI